MNFGKIKVFFLCGISSLILTACSTVENSHRQKNDMMYAYYQGNNQAVIDEINYKLREPHWYNTSVVNSVDEVMWRLEAGSMNFHLGRFDESIEQFRIAEDLIEEYDERAIISFKAAGSEFGMTLTNLNVLPYRGFCRDRIALSFYKALAYLGSRNTQRNARNAYLAQLRRLRDEHKKVQEDYAKFFEMEEAEIKAAKAKNPDAAKKFDGNGNSGAMSVATQNADFAAALEDAKTVANRGYGNFLNPAAIFLSGLGCILDNNNYENARIEFKRLYEAMPNNPVFQKYYVTALKRVGMKIPAELQQVKPFDFSLGNDCVYVISAHGRSAALKQIAVYFPIMTAWPVCEFYASPFKTLNAGADGKSYPGMILADMDGVFAQEFQERLPGMITRIVLSTMIKEAAYYGSLAAVWASNMDPIVKVCVATGIIIGGTIYRTAMNTADTRSWEILPKEYHLTQLPMPKNREVEITLTGNRNISEKVKIPGDCRSAVVFVSAPSESNVKFHVLPIR